MLEPDFFISEKAVLLLCLGVGTIFLGEWDSHSFFGGCGTKNHQVQFQQVNFGKRGGTSFFYADVHALARLFANS